MISFIGLIAFLIFSAFLFIKLGMWVGGRVGGIVYDTFFRRKDRHEYILRKFKDCK